MASQLQKATCSLLSFNPTDLSETWSYATLFSADRADDILGPINYDVSENAVYITWQEPAAPNGIIILYEVNYKKVGDTEVKTCTPPHICTLICHALLL